MVTIGLACMDSSRPEAPTAPHRPEAGDRLAMGVEHGDQIARGRGSLFGGLRDAGQEELHPGLPRPGLPDLLQEPVVVVAPRSSGTG